MESTTTTGGRTNIPAILVGACLLLTAAFGLFYNALTMIAAWKGAFDPLLKGNDLPYFYPAFFAMSAVCVTCYVALIACAVDLLRSKLRSSRLVSMILILEVIYFFAVGFWWSDPSFGQSIGAATGVANGGMMVQFIILLPLWGPLMLWWAASPTTRSEAQENIANAQ